MKYVSGRFNLARTRAILAVAAASVVGASAHADYDASLGTGTTYNIVTAGATALSKLNTQESGNNNLTRLGNVIGSSSSNFLQIGNTKYWNTDLNFAQTLVSPSPVVGNPDVWSYSFHQTGSLEGIQDLAVAQGIAFQGSPIPLAATSTNPWYINGVKSTSGTPSSGTTVQLAWSDVTSNQAFAVNGTPNVNAIPGSAGYGLGRGNVGGTNFQQYRNIGTVTGGQSSFRNETVGIVPFTVSANPGTGLETLTGNDAKWLNTTGRLSNGANFNVSTRDAGSGTRNQGANNLNFDPSWASGERDRKFLGDGIVTSYTIAGPQGPDVTVNIGDEAAPLRNLKDGTTILAANEDRISPDIRYADKTGGRRVREVVQYSRLALGIISAGDAKDAGLNQSKQNPVRALAVNFDNNNNGAGFYQPTAENVTLGNYRLWSQEQAVTVVGPGDTINGDTAEGSVRKFIDNIVNSTGNFTGTGTVFNTPADGVLNNGFLLPGFMAVTKNFDGDTQVSRPRPLETAYQNWKTSGGDANLNWAVPSAQDGFGGAGSYYNIYNAGNTSASSNSAANKSIKIEARTALAGDFNNDGVRDLQDVPKLADAYLNGSAFVADAANGLNFVPANGNGIANTEADNLTVIGDFTSQGSFNRESVRFFLYGASVDTTDTSNAALDAAYTAFNGHTTATATAQDRRSVGVRVGYLKKNTAIDNFNAELDAQVTAGLINPSTSLPFTQSEVNALKFDKFDVNRDGLVNKQDALVVHEFIGTNYTNLSDQLNAVVKTDGTPLNEDPLVSILDRKMISLVDVELTDNGAIDFANDFSLIRSSGGPAGTQLLLLGDATLDNNVDLADFDVWFANLGTSNAYGRWGHADFNADLSTDLIDFDTWFLNLGQTLSLSELRAEITPIVGADFADVLVDRAAAVPEPTSLAFVGAAVGLFGLRRPRRRRHS